MQITDIKCCLLEHIPPEPDWDGIEQRAVLIA